MATSLLRTRRLAGKAVRPLFERRFTSDWSGPPAGLRYWDGRRTAVGSGSAVADVENLWRHYEITLQHWADNFAAAWGPLRAMTDERFMRAWWLYLNASRAVFASGRCQLWQVVITRDKLAPLPLTREGWLANERKRPVRQRVEAKEPAVAYAGSRR